MSAVVAVDTKKLNSQEFYDELDRLTGASIGVVAIRTREVERAKTLLHQWASMRDGDFATWDPLTGWGHYKRLPVIQDSEDDDRPAINLDGDLSDFLAPTRKEPAAVVLDVAWQKYQERMEKKDTRNQRYYGCFIGITNDHLQDLSVQQHIRNHVQRAYQCEDRAFIVLSPGVEIPDAIKGDIEIIDLHTPSFAELLEQFTDVEEDIPEGFGLKLTDDDRTMIVQNGLGMTGQEFENAIALGIVDLSTKLKRAHRAKKKFKVTAHDFVQVVRNRKLEILKQTKILELLPEAQMSEVGGLDVLKGWINKRKRGYTPEAREFGIKPPKGMLLVGPPGTAKSLISRAVGSALGLPTIKVDIGAIYNSLVGASEARARMVTQMLEEMAPCVAFFDEVDKSVGSGGDNGDSGTSRRVFGHFLTWFQEKNDKNIPVFIVASANNVQMIPPEFMRRGRFDAIWALAYPNIDERKSIFKIHVEKRGHTLEDNEYLTLAKASKGYVGAEIESAIEDALFDDFDAGHSKLMVATVKDALDAMIPQARAFPERIAAMEGWCKANARMASAEANFDVMNEEQPGIVKVKRRPGIRSPKLSHRN